MGRKQKDLMQGWPLLAIGVFLVGLLSTACSEQEGGVAVADRADQLQADLVDDGVSVGVAECVTRLAEHDLRSGEIGAVVLDELVLNCERAERILEAGVDGENRDRDLAFVDGPNTLGDDLKLDRLWRTCADGSGQACDDLFHRSPVGSEYEQFGVSCGRRDDVLDCSQLDDVDKGDVADN